MSNNKTLPAYITSKGPKAMERYNDFAQFRLNLATLRAQAGVSADKFYNDLKLKNPKRVYDYECGRCHPSFDELRAIAKYFQVTLDELLYKKAIISFI